MRILRAVLRAILGFPFLILGIVLLTLTLMVLHFSSWLSPHCRFEQTSEPGKKRDKITLEWVWGKK